MLLRDCCHKGCNLNVDTKRIIKDIEEESVMSDTCKTNTKLFLIVVLFSLIFLVGCYTARNDNVDLSGLSYYNGSFSDRGEGSATLDLRFAQGGTVPIGTKYLWRTTFEDFSGQIYNVSVVLYAKEFRNGWVLESCPVWQLNVNGRSVSKDAQGSGHWSMIRKLSVGGVTLDVSWHRRICVSAKVFVDN